MKVKKSKKLDFIQSFYYSFKTSIQKGDITEGDFLKIIQTNKNLFQITEYELRGGDDEVIDFISKNNLLVSPIEIYDYTESYEDYIYSFDRLNLHLTFSEIAFFTLNYVAESNFESVLEDFNLSEDSDLYDWEVFENKLNLTRGEIIFEQALISLLTIFETYISNILQWIFQKDEVARNKIRVNINYEEVLSNIGEIIEFLIVKRVEQIRSWDDRIETINAKPISIKVKNKPEYKLIKDAIAKRNVLIHNKGEVNNIFIKEILKNDVSAFNVDNNYSLNDKVKIDRSYYYKIQNAVKQLVKFIDAKVKDKYVAIGNK